MLRIWKGPEMEGNQIGIMTLFVCSDVEVDTKRLISIIQQNPDIRRIYFGAGKHSFNGVSSWRDLYDYLFIRSIEVVMEVEPAMMGYMIAKYDNLITTFVISNYNMPFTYNNVQFKTDNNEVVKIYSASSQTSLKTLKDNNLFTCDIMLLEED